MLQRTDALNEIIREVHPHYMLDDYKLFMIITQGCDLVRRAGTCSTRYIEIATVRPMDEVLNRQLRRYQDATEERAGVCSEQARVKFIDFVKTLLNNNASEYFYLRDDANLGLGTELCAFLRESIPLRATHYETLLKARIASLDETFQAKLGWLVGQLYSRVATDDWVPKSATEAEFDAKANAIADSTCLWVESRKLRAAKKNITPETSDAEARRIISGAKSVAKKTEILVRVCKVIEEKFPAEYGRLRNLQQLLSSDDELKGLF